MHVFIQGTILVAVHVYTCIEQVHVYIYIYYKYRNTHILLLQQFQRRVQYLHHESRSAVPNKYMQKARTKQVLANNNCGQGLADGGD